MNTKRSKKKDEGPPIRLLDYLPADPRFDNLRRIFTANELNRMKQADLELRCENSN